MKKTTLLILFATFTLLGLLGLQIYYVVETAAAKEEQFNENVSMALCKVADMMCSDEKSCEGWESCCMKRSHEEEGCSINLNSEQKARIDSLLSYYMDYYHIRLDYSYEVIRTDNLSQKESQSTIFGQKLNPGVPGEYQLRLELPGKDQFILSEMKGVFISSVILILALIAIFWMTIKTLLKSNATLKRTTDFVNNMTHELNTPIANIGLAASGLLKPTATDERKSSYAAIIKSENERLKKQVERLLDITKLEYSGLCLRLEKLNIHELLEEQINTFALLIKENDGSILTDLRATSTTINGDRVLLSNVISNLLDNALKYSGDKPEIRILTENAGELICLSVSDKGRGIPENEQNLIFEKYYRINTGDVHDIKGFGLGLTYVRKVIEAHGGTISVQSSEGKGSVFTVKLPVA